jgi:hypothetical protein
MDKCRLGTSCSPAEGTNAFASGWDQLEKLSLSKSRADSHILAVNMPSLQQLKLKGFSIYDDAGEEALHGSVQAFALGCPRATYVEFDLLLTHAPGPYKMFAALERLQLALAPMSAMEVYGQWDTPLEVPGSLTKLEFTSAAEQNMENWDPDPDVSISLHRALSVAAACIRAGAPVQSLILAHCTTLELVHEEDDSDDDEDGAHMVGPDLGEIVRRYRPAAVALHGLVRLDLSESLGCGEAAVNEVVSSAPSLKSLVLGIKEPFIAQRRVLVCSGLQEVHIKLDVPDTGDALKVTFFLEDTAALCSCMLEVLDEANNLHQGDKLALVLSCDEMAGITISVIDHRFLHTPPPGFSVPFLQYHWLLGLEVRDAEVAEGSVQKQATIIFLHDDDEYCWASALKVE